MKKIIYAVVGLLCLALAFASYQYLALTLFRVGLSDFYNVAAQVPEQCSEVVASAVVAFTGTYTYISWIVALVLLVIAVYCFYRIIRPSA